ncbi:lysozyme [Actinomadura flavalba]|uniref:lysozyme n=1 Tax=Actinomadura flavalba TaxID=1120938 RepID=UPI00036BAF98|nr:lysozyme [Actinomadura flavalba]
MARILALSLILSGGLAASALAAPGAAAAPADGPDRHWLGSQIAKREPAARRAPAAGVLAVPQTPGLDVSSWQGNVNWASVAANGAKFAYVKATESTGYRNPYFAQQYNGSYNAGLIRGAYHFAVPNISSGAVQADYFVNNGGGWSADGRTLPGLLDVEWNPYGAACYGLSQTAMVNWIRAFSDRYRARTGRYPAIYTSTSWWTQCTGNLGGFATTNPLMIANYNGTPGPMPFNWTYQTIWQWSDRGVFPGDQNYFNGDLTRLRAFARS